MKSDQQKRGSHRKKHQRSNERTNYDKHAQAAPVGDQSRQELLSASQATRVLGVSPRTFRRHVAEGRILPFSKSPGGHGRFRRIDLEVFHASPVLGHAPPSPVLRERRERIEELNLQLQEKKTGRLLQDLDDQEARRRQQEESARQAQEREARRIRLDAEAAAARRERERQEREEEEAAEASRQEWQAQWLRDVLARLPRDIPAQLRLDVADAVRQRLPELYETCAGHAEDLAGATLQAVLDETLRPWRRRNTIAEAAAHAANELPLFARGDFGHISEWEIRAKEEATAAIESLSGTASPDQMIRAARAAGHRVAHEFTHRETCEAAIAKVTSSLPRQLPFTSAQQRATALNAVRVAFDSLPIGATRAEFDAVSEVALDPFVAAESQVRSERAAEEARTKIEHEAKRHLEHVFSYLAQLQADPQGWDFEGKLYEISKQIAEAIKPDLIQDLPLDFLAGRRRVEELIDELLSNQASA